MRLVVEDGVRREAFVTYLSSMLQAGIPDLFVQSQGASVWLELKFARLLSSKAEAGALTHTVTGPQRRFLRDVITHGGFGFVLVGFEVGEKYPRVALLELKDFDDRGQVTCGALRRAARQSTLEKGVVGPWLLAQLADVCRR